MYSHSKRLFSPPSPTPLMLLNLPPELLEEIGVLLIRDDLKALRSANKNVQEAVDPAFFAEFPINSTALGSLSESDFSFLRTIAGGETPWSRHAKTLSVFPGLGASTNDFPFDTADDNGFSEARELFAAALGSMSNIRTVLWKVARDESEWVRQVICDSICAFPQLEHFNIGFFSGAELAEVPGEFIETFASFSKAATTIFTEEFILNTIIAGLPSTRSVHIKACGCVLAPQNACFGRCADADDYREVDDICHGLKRAVEGFSLETINSTDLHVDGNVYDLRPLESSDEDDDESTGKKTTISYRCREPVWTPLKPRDGRVERRVPHRFPDPEIAARYYAMATAGHR
ncbi:hypothetical protein B0H12DRAFT_1226578 [Mycena haematopus]|nr:hypothetical protein B0H12DRAFT_1226578 [Mycena haematopus]